MKKILFGVVLLILGIGLYNVYKPLPKYVGYASPLYKVDDKAVKLLTDRTYLNEQGEQIFEHQIFDTMIEQVKTANSYILADMFLFNNQLGKSTTPARRSLSTELAEALAVRQASSSALKIHVITDPINSAYGSYTPTPLKILEQANIPIITTQLSPLRDSNPFYSALWRSLLHSIPNIGGHWLTNPFDPTHEKSTVSAYLRAFNFKANHRKLLLTDTEEAGGEIRWRTLIASMNPHDGSSRHSNVGVVIEDALASDLLKTEQVVADFSGGINLAPTVLPNYGEDHTGVVEVQLLTEQAIKNKVLQSINELKEGDEIKLAMFYFSDRDIVNAMKEADDRGVKIKILLDPNKDAFGREKNGIPNRQVAHELMKSTQGGTEIRWCLTSGEQCHSKLLITRSGEKMEVILGSANYTRRNLDNLNLETDVRIIGTASTTAISDAVNFFTEQWGNEQERSYSVSYETYADTSVLKTIWYRIGEFTGMSHY